MTNAWHIHWHPDPRGPPPATARSASSPVRTARGLIPLSHGIDNTRRSYPGSLLVAQLTQHPQALSPVGPNDVELAL